MRRGPVLSVVLLVGCAAAAYGKPPIMGKPSTVNPYNGMQTPEQVFEFSQKPKVQKPGEKWVITFASKGKCDATVAILDKEGKIIRHLASGVLGANAPWPFQQNSFSQRLEWDGLKDDFTRADPEGCTVRVSLGLSAEFERGLLWDPNELSTFEYRNGKLWPGDNVLMAEGKDGEIYVIDATGSKTMRPNGRVYDKEGKYLRTFFPPAAADAEKLMTKQGYKMATTIWGDRVVIGGTYGWFNGNRKDARKKPVMVMGVDAVEMLKAHPGVGEIKEAPRPSVVPASSLHRIKDARRDESVARAMQHKFVRMTVDPVKEQVYFGYSKSNLWRLNGNTGETDLSWFPKGWLMPVDECCYGPDGLLYLRIGVFGYGQWVIRLDHEGKPVPFVGEAVEVPKYNWPDDKERYGGCAGGKFGGLSPRPRGLKKAGTIMSMWTGEMVHSNTHTRGLHVSPNGMIVAGLLFQSIKKIGGAYPKYLLDRGMPDKDAPWSHKSFVAVMDTTGKYYWANAVGDTKNGHNVFMDRDGNIYTGIGGITTNKDKPYGIAEGGTCGNWGGIASLGKYQWKGDFPLATVEYPASPRDKVKRPGLLWSYPGMPGYAQACTCHNNRSDMDEWARMWVSGNYLGSVMVLDANGNVIARIGRYGNVDDADEKCGKIHFAWIRAVAASDKAVYAVDPPNRRILKAALKYAAEEEVSL